MGQLPGAQEDQRGDEQALGAGGGDGRTATCAIVATELTVQAKRSAGKFHVVCFLPQLRNGDNKLAARFLSDRGLPAGHTSAAPTRPGRPSSSGQGHRRLGGVSWGNEQTPPCAPRLSEGPPGG